MVDRKLLCDECYLDAKLCGKRFVEHCPDCKRKSARAETYTLTSMTGRKIRQATRVRFADGSTVAFLDKLPKRVAIEQALMLPVMA